MSDVGVRERSRPAGLVTYHSVEELLHREELLADLLELLEHERARLERAMHLALELSVSISSS